MRNYFLHKLICPTTAVKEVHDTGLAKFLLDCVMIEMKIRPFKARLNTLEAYFKNSYYSWDEAVNCLETLVRAGLIDLVTTEGD
jgi:hypothetical protein